MDGVSIFGSIIMLLCSLFCSGAFWGIAVWAKKRKDPMHFYSGVAIDPKTVSDIPAYNLANARMWQIFSVPFFLSFIASIFSFFVPWAIGVCAVLLFGGCIIGIPWLLLRYRKIADKYIIR